VRLPRPGWGVGVEAVDIVLDNAQHIPVPCTTPFQVLLQVLDVLCMLAVIASQPPRGIGMGADVRKINPIQDWYLLILDIFLRHSEQGILMRNELPSGQTQRKL